MTEVRETVLELLAQLGSSREARQYLKEFSSVDETRFAVVKIGGGVLADRMSAKDQRWYAWLPSICGFLIVPFMVLIYRSQTAGYQRHVKSGRNLLKKKPIKKERETYGGKNYYQTAGT